MLHQDKLWKRLEEIMIPLELRIVLIRIYENLVAKLKTNYCLYKEIKCNISVKKRCPLSPKLLIFTFKGLKLVWKLQDALTPSSLRSSLLLPFMLRILFFWPKA